MKSYATNHYRSKVSAIKYHELFGFSREQAKAILAAGMVQIGQPPLAAGETLIELEGGRYAIQPPPPKAWTASPPPVVYIPDRRPSVDEWLAAALFSTTYKKVPIII